MPLFSKEKFRKHVLRILKHNQHLNFMPSNKLYLFIYYEIVHAIHVNEETRKKTQKKVYPQIIKQLRL